MNSGDRQLLNLLFLCTGNSARSIMAEAITNKIGSDKIQAFSAGSRPVGVVHPLAVQLLGKLNYSTSSLKSKSWTEFAAPNAEELELVITVCDNARAEECPVWPGNPALGHWSIPDPAQLNSDFAAFKSAYDLLTTLIQALVDLPLAGMSAAELKKHLNGITTHID